MKKLFLLTLTVILLFKLPVVKAQELNCQISINAPRLSEVDRRVLETLRDELREFINQRNWTDYEFQQQERIEATISVTVNERNGDEFVGTMQVQSRRPVFNSSYNSPLLNHQDRDVRFRYIQNQPIDYTDNTYSNNLSSHVAFYVYIILGLDFDSFAPFGGTPFFEKAQNIVNLAQSAADPGWRSHEGSRNRYWLIENIFNPSYRPIRQAMYTYHRLGFDRLVDNIESGRTEVINAIEMLHRAQRNRPGSFWLQLLMTTKSDEIVNLISEASPADKARVVNMLAEVDPANASRYRQLSQ
jgi:hypothetical protein